MSEFLRAAIVGTGQSTRSSSELTGTAVDDLVARLGELDRERALLLRAGGRAALRRAAAPLITGTSSLPRAPAESLGLPSPAASEVLAQLLESDQDELLLEALERLASARLRLPEALLPLALQSAGALARERLRPVLGERGRWLARLVPRASWALVEAGPAALPADAEQRWAEGTAAERRRLFAAAREVAPEQARVWLSNGWKQEKVEQRVAFLELLDADLSVEDEPLLALAATDRSANVRRLAGQLAWRLPNSEVAARMRARLEGLVRFKPATSGVVSSLKRLVGVGGAGTLEVELPPEPFDPSWERDGVAETPPYGSGRRQFWLAQMVSAIPPELWTTRFGAKPEALLKAALQHDLGGVLLDGLTSAALRFGAKDWYAVLWDGWVESNAAAVLSVDPLPELTARLAPSEAEERLVPLLDTEAAGLARYVARPWPEALARRVLAGLRDVRADWTELLPAAALGLPLDVLPETIAAPEVPELTHPAALYLRALEKFAAIVATRRTLAREIPT